MSDPTRPSTYARASIQIVADDVETHVVNVLIPVRSDDFGLAAQEAARAIQHKVPSLLLHPIPEETRRRVNAHGEPVPEEGADDLLAIEDSRRAERMAAVTALPAGVSLSVADALLEYIDTGRPSS